jgi:DNA polymerase-3 subunit alpha
MSAWFPLHQHSHFSLLDGLSKPEQMANRLLECGYAGGALTDHGNLGGCPGFLKALAKKKLKPVLGCEFYLCKQDAALKTQENRPLSHLCVLAKNKAGWKHLMKASSASYRPEHNFYKPRLDLDRLASFSKGEFVVFSGHPGSDLANVCFEDYRAAYGCRSYDDAKGLVRKDWEQAVTGLIRRYQTLFGKDNFFLEIQLVDHKNVPASLVVARILRHVGKKLGVPRVATADSHYCRQEDAPDQRVLLCSALDTTLKEVQRKLDNAEDVTLGAFFRSNNYHIPSPDEMRDLHGDCPDELENALRIADGCETYEVGNKPLLPHFKCPGGKAPDDYLAELCEEGFKAIVQKRVPRERWPEYRRRLDEVEFPVVRGTGGFLADYFLIKQDIIGHARKVLKAKTGPGRGSAAGCLVSYLTGITRVDPLKYNLSFARFYNAGRNSPGRIQLPDIDSDFPIKFRESVIQHIRDTYGADRVCQMATFSRMQGRGALKDVLRAHERCGFDEMNRITEHIPDEAAIADKLQEMMEETGEASIIQYALESDPEPLREWAFLDENGFMQGPYALDFAQAIRLEGTKRNMGKHASGIVICSEPLEDICPMVFDKGSGEMMTGVDMRDAEAMGLPKVDILGLRTQDCIMDAEAIVRTGSAE